MYSTTDTASEATITAAIIEIVSGVIPTWQPATAIIRSATATVCGEADAANPLIEVKYYDISSAAGITNPCITIENSPDDVIAAYYPPERHPNNARQFAACGAESISVEASILSSITTLTLLIKRHYDINAPAGANAISNIPRTLAQNYIIPHAAARIVALLAANTTDTNERLSREQYAQWLITNHKIPAAPAIATSRARTGQSFGGDSFVPGSYTAEQVLSLDARIAALVNNAPSGLDTLNELAAALGNDANFATTITNSLTTKANKNGTGLSVGEVIAWKTLLGLGTAAGLNVPVSGNAAAGEVVKGNDTRITGAATTGKAIAMAIVFGG